MVTAKHKSKTPSPSGNKPKTKIKKKAAKKENKLAQTATVGAACLVVMLLAYGVFKFLTPSNENSVHLNVGKSTVLNFPGKESVEVRWRFNRTRSSNFKILDVRLLGWTYKDNNRPLSTRTNVGAERTSRFEIYAKSPGVSTLTFELARRGSPETNKAIRTRSYTIHVKP
ncbi:MAG: hypothetical protein AAF228_00110 [Pseudomonadota bacterium]